MPAQQGRALYDKKLQRVTCPRLQLQLSRLGTPKKVTSLINGGVLYQRVKDNSNNIANYNSGPGIVPLEGKNTLATKKNGYMENQRDQ